jgi:integrase
MRPEEALALEWRDIDLKAAVASVERVRSQGRTKPCKKSDRQQRRVPLRAGVLAELEKIPQGFGRTLFPGHDGDYIHLETFRLRHWTPALRAAGIEHRSVYTCRHTFAAWAIAVGVQLFYLSRITARPWRRSTRHMDTSSPIPRTTCEGSWTSTTPVWR